MARGTVCCWLFVGNRCPRRQAQRWCGYGGGRRRRFRRFDDARSGGDFGFGFTSDPEDAGLEFIVLTECDANLSEQGVVLLAA